MTLSEAARTVRRKQRAMRAAGRKAGLDVGALAVGEAIRLSSGTVPTAVLSAPLSRTFRRSRGGHRAGLGHPYGRGSSGGAGPRGSVPYGDPSIVNAQSGGFRAAWRLVPTARGFRLENDSPHARRLAEGTPLMIARPILGAIADNSVRPQARALTIAALEAAWKSG